MKGLYLRGGVYWYRFTPAPGAAQVRASTECTDEALAIIRAREIRDQARGEILEQMEACQVEIDAHLAAMRRKRLANSTLVTRKYVLQSFVSEIGAATPKQVTPAQAKTWFERLWDTHPHTASDYLTSVRLWYAWLIDRGKLSTDPTAGIVVPTLPMRTRRPFLLPQEARQVLETCLDDKLKYCLYCALHAGFRKLEVIESVDTWFDLDAGLIHIDATPTFEPKDRDKRTIPITDEFRAWLKNVYKLQRPFMLAPEVKHGKYRYRWDFKKRFKSHMKACGFEHITFHDLRRTFASLLASKGVSIYKIAKWLGDDVDVVQDTYAHLIQQDDDINAAWEKPAKKKTSARRVTRQKARGGRRHTVRR
jgi:integrase